MLKIKYFLIITLFTLVATSCSNYSKILNKGTSIEQYGLATELYEAGKYNKSIELFEKVIPAYRGKPQMERIQYMVSDANYQTKNYLLAGYHFDRFTKNYPKSTKNEAASFLSAHAYYLSIPKSSLDQSDTQTAIEAFQKFIDKYPTSDKVAEANSYVKEMQYRLEKKEFDIAYQYYHTENYVAAVTSFDNFLSDNLGTSFKEEALYYKSKAAHDLAMKSVTSKKEKRVKEALKAINRLEHNFKETKFLKEIEKLKENLKHELLQLATTTNK